MMLHDTILNDYTLQALFYQPIHLSTYLGIYLYTFPIAQQSTCLPIHMSHKQSGLQNGWLLRANIPSHGFSA